MVVGVVVVVVVVGGASCTESQLVGGGGGGHRGGNSQGAGQEACAQSFGEILGKGESGLEGGREREREGSNNE